MAQNLTELHAVLSQMESALKNISEMDAEILEFIDSQHPDLLNDQKLIQVFKNVGDAEDELQRQLNFLRKRLTAGIPEFDKICELAA